MAVPQLPVELRTGSPALGKILSFNLDITLVLLYLV